MALNINSKGLEISTNGWNDWKWQVHNRIDTVEKLANIVKLSAEEKRSIREASEIFPMSITPYYASLINGGDPNCPIRRQAIPDSKELKFCDHDMMDPLHEEKDSPCPGVTHRYPDRVLLLATNECAMYCRHCTRKRKVGDENKNITFSQIKKGIEYIQENKKIRDVLISGGDPFIMKTSSLEKIVSLIRAIPHVEIIRIGTRTPVVLPQRITPELVNMLKKYHPIWVNTHFNHPLELTGEAQRALKLLADAGIPLGNQSVLLNGVNDCPEIMKKLVQKLLVNRVRPYYIYQCDLSRGIEHFRTKISAGVEILERLIGHTTGLAVPRFIVDAPGGGGKIPLQPNYFISHTPQKTVLRNYEGVITVYKEPGNYVKDSGACPAFCDLCKTPLSEESDAGFHPIGLEKLLDDRTNQVSLIPKGNSRKRRFKVKIH